MTKPNETTGADSASALTNGLERFDAWWDAHGQFCRAGGGDYEKTFAFRAWEEAVKGERDACLSAVRGVMVTDHSVNTWKRCVAAIEKRSNAEVWGDAPTGAASRTTAGLEGGGNTESKA